MGYMYIYVSPGVSKPCFQIALERCSHAVKQGGGIALGEASGTVAFGIVDHQIPAVKEVDGDVGWALDMHGSWSGRLEKNKK